MQQIEDLGPAGLHAGQAELPTQLVGGLGKRHLMAAFGGDPRRLEPRGPAAHHQHALTLPGRREGIAAPFELASRRGIDQAGDPIIPRAAAPAHLVAGDAGADIADAPLARLVGEMGVGDLAAHDAHHIGLARGDDVIRILRRADMALRLDADMLGHLLQRLGEGGAQLVLIDEGRDDLGEVEIAAGAAGDVVVEPAGIMPGEDLLLVGDREHVGPGDVDADGHAEDEILAGELAHAGQHLGGEAHAVLEAAAVAVGAPVGVGGPELLQQRVIGGHDLRAVEARLLVAPRGLAEAFDQFGDLGLAHPVAAVGIMHRGQARGRPGRIEAVVPIAMGADVIHLMDHHRAVLMAGIGDAPEMGNDRVAFGQEIAPGQHRGLMDRRGLDDDHRRAAAGPLAVIAEVALRRQPLDAHIGGMGAEVEAVLQRLVAQLQGLEEVRESLLGHSVGTPFDMEGRS